MSKYSSEGKEKPIFDLWCETTSAHGWSDWLTARSQIARACWSLLLITCCLALGVSIAMLIINFANSEKWTTTVYEDEGKKNTTGFFRNPLPPPPQ